MLAIHVSDLHGSIEKYGKLGEFIKENLPEAVFITGDVLPNYYAEDPEEFVLNFLEPFLNLLKLKLKENYPAIFIIFGNDDPAQSSYLFEDLNKLALIKFINNKYISFKGFNILGYPYIPPTPFMLKDWEKYDISRFVPRGAVSPEDGIRTIEIPKNIIQNNKIKDDLELLKGMIADFGKTICLFHSPPIDTFLDNLEAADISGNKIISHAGSYAIRKFIESKQPLLCLHGNLHESTELSGSWKDIIGNTFCFNAAHSGRELSVIKFNTDSLQNAERVLI
ncbi:MAG: metallophosphoesterase [Ignavibacteria bacterium]|nr:metallophosphoesterase [Ignavibacteria bacterium]